GGAASTAAPRSYSPSHARHAASRSTSRPTPATRSAASTRTCRPRGVTSTATIARPVPPTAKGDRDDRLPDRALLPVPAGCAAPASLATVQPAALPRRHGRRPPADQGRARRRRVLLLVVRARPGYAGPRARGRRRTVPG